MIVRVSTKLTDHAKSYQRAHYHFKRDRHKKKRQAINIIFFKYFYGLLFFFLCNNSYNTGKNKIVDFCEQYNLHIVQLHSSRKINGSICLHLY